MTIFNKIKWILGVLLVFLLIVSTNLIDRNNFNQVQGSIETIYEERLVAKGILFDLSNQLHEKEIAFILQDTTFFSKNNNAINASIDKLISVFTNTRLSYEEQKTLNQLLLNFNKLKDVENKLKSDVLENSQTWVTQLINVKNDLEELSKIQIKEGGKQLMISKKAMSAVELYTRIEIYLLIILALVIQFLIIYSPNKKSN